MTSSTRTKYEVALEPLIGSRFQPTGFPDLGAAIFARPGAEGENLLVESVQSMANRLEGLTWSESTNTPDELLATVPYVRVVDADGAFLTSSRLEAHRLASPYILNATPAAGGQPLISSLPDEFGLAKGKPLDNRMVAQRIFELDPLSLVHGVFFAQSKWAWQPKVSRAVTCFIEASNVQPAVSGGVKKDGVTNTSGDEGQTSREGYGMVPHHRTEYTAESITLYAVVDEAQITSYGLSPSATELLSAVANWEIATLLNSGMRLRTACDLVVKESSLGDVPGQDEANQRLNTAIAAAKGQLRDITEVAWSPAKSTAKSAK